MELVILLIVAGVCGGIAQGLAGYSRRGCLVSIALGFGDVDKFRCLTESSTKNTCRNSYKLRHTRKHKTRSIELSRYTYKFWCSRTSGAASISRYTH